MKKTKIMRTAAAITAAVLISGGVYLMFRNDLAQKLSYRRLKPFMPDIAVFDERMPDRAEITDEPDNSARLPEDKKRELTEQAVSYTHLDVYKRQQYSCNAVGGRRSY